MFTSSRKFSKIDAKNTFLFQVNIFGKNIKETITLAKYFTKVTVCPRVQ